MNTSIKEQFREYLANCVQTRRQTNKSFIIGRTTVDSYVSFAEVDKLFDYALKNGRRFQVFMIFLPQRKFLVLLMNC